MTRAMLDALLLLAVPAAYHLRGVVDDYRMRRVLVRINAEVNRAVSETRDAHRA